MMSAPPCSRRRRPPVGGFTLIEVLVSMFILSVLAAAAWKGLDAIGTARQVADGNLQQTLRVQSVMTQLDADLAQVMDTQVVKGFQFDGANLRLTRRTAAGVQVVVWAVREGRLLRWTSPETSQVGELQDHWRRSYQLLGREPGTLVALKGVEQWLVYCFRSGALSNCQSTGNVVSSNRQTGGAAEAGGGASSPSPAGADPGAAALVREELPSAVRSQIYLGEGSGLSGVVTRDILLSPQP
jgi:general secretion pathway protein J